MWSILLIVLLINLATSQDFIIYTSKELYAEKDLKIQVNNSYSYRVSCDNQPNYLQMTKQFSNIVELSYKERQQAGCSDSKFNFALNYIQNLFYTFYFIDENNVVLEQFILPNPKETPKAQYIPRNQVIMKRRVNSLQDIYISNTTNSTSYIELKVCADTKSIDFILYSIIGDNLNWKSLIQPYYGNYYMYNATGTNISFYTQIIPKQQNIDTPTYSIRYLSYDPNSIVQYDQFSINGSLIINENEESVEIILPRIESQIYYSYVKFVIFFSYDKYAQLLECSLADQNVKPYFFERYDSVILYQNKNDNDHIKFEFKGEQYDKPYVYNYTYVFAQVYVGEQQITLPIGGSIYKYQSNKISYLEYSLVFILITCLMSLFCYIIYRNYRNRKINRDIELNYYKSSQN